MCGIVGFISPDHANREQILGQMMEAIRHRGPDDSDKTFINNVAFGHQRLSIIDIANGKQPMTDPSERFTIIFNGEIYNYLELRQRLNARDHKFQTYSDTEVLLHMYMEFGKEMLQYLNGMFAFAIHDKIENTTFLARDHFGIKPLYYHQQGDNFIFGSEIKALLKHPSVSVSVNPESFNEYLTFQLGFGTNTLFKGVEKLPPASYAVVKGSKVTEINEYWKIDYTVDESKTEEQYADELLVLLDSSLSIQTRSDVPVGAYLSGGLDSSIVSTLAAKKYFGDFSTFTGGFRESADYDETYYAKKVSEHINSQHFEIFPTHTDFESSIKDLIYHMDEPCAGPGLFPQYMVSKLASQHVKVVLGGQGGDEIFGGYARYAVAYLEQCIKGAIFETQEEANHIVTLGSIIENLPMLKQYMPMIKQQFSKGMFDPMDRRYYNLINRSPNLHKVYSGDVLAQRSDEALFEKFSSIFNAPSTPSYFNKMTYFDIKTLLPALLQVEDRVSMAVSLESRVPLLDHRIVDIAAKMSPLMKFSGGKTKHMLLQSVKNILPKEIVERKDKMGFPTPVNEWLAGPLKEFALDTLAGKKAQERGIFNTESITKLIDKESRFNRDLWGALCIELWHQNFVD